MSGPSSLRSTFWLSIGLLIPLIAATPALPDRYHTRLLVTLADLDGSGNTDGLQSAVDMPVWVPLSVQSLCDLW